MTCINDVRLQGKLLKAPEFAETSTKKRFARLTVETEEYVRVNGESRRLADVHQIVVYNQFSLPALEEARAGTYVTVAGKLKNARNGGAEILVSQYQGEARIVSFAGPAPASDAAPSAPERAERPAAPSRSGGGLGRLSRIASDEPTDDPRESDGPGKPTLARQSGPSRLQDSELDDDIPF